MDLFDSESPQLLLGFHNDSQQSFQLQAILWNPLFSYPFAILIECPLHLY
jgi:hypothetical protein